MKIVIRNLNYKNIKILMLNLTNFKTYFLTTHCIERLCDNVLLLYVITRDIIVTLVL